MLITQNGEAKLVVMDVRSYEEHAQTFALLKLLALGNSEIEQGKYRPADEVFAEMDKELLQLKLSFYSQPNLTLKSSGATSSSTASPIRNEQNHLRAAQ